MQVLLVKPAIGSCQNAEEHLFFGQAAPGKKGNGCEVRQRQLRTAASRAADEQATAYPVDIGKARLGPRVYQARTVAFSDPVVSEWSLAQKTLDR